MWRYNNELYHHGILGMKWGVRRYQKKDGTLTPKGKQREKRLTHRQRIEQKYISKGMTPEHAKIQAGKRIRTEKILATVGVLTVTAAAAYGVYHHNKYGVDKIIKEGGFVKTVNNRENGVQDAFYASFNKKDSVLYEGIFGQQLKAQNANASVYVNRMKAVKDIKIASTKTARQTLQNMINKDPSYSDKVAQLFAEYGGSNNPKVQNAMKQVRQGRVSKKTYDIFNQALVGRNIGSDGYKNVVDTFYNTLKSKGYSAVQDINDMKYSGYGAKTPTIFFDAGKTFTKDSVSKLSDSEIIKNAAKGKRRIITTGLAKTGGKIGGAAAGVGLMRSTIELKAINKYKSEHPGTKKSDSEILAFYGY